MNTFETELRAMFGLRYLGMYQNDNMEMGEMQQ